MLTSTQTLYSCAIFFSKFPVEVIKACPETIKQLMRRGKVPWPTKASQTTISWQKYCIYAYNYL